MDKKQQTFNINFFIKKSKPLRNGEAPIVVRISVCGQVGDISLQRSIIPSLWDQTKERSKTKDHAGRELNNYIESVRTRIYDIRRDFEDKGKLVTLDVVRDKYYGRDAKTLLRIKTIVGIYQEYNEKCRALIGKEFTKSTVDLINHIYTSIKEKTNIQPTILLR